MGQKRRGSSPWPLILTSALLLLAPAGASQRARLLALSGFLPLQGLVRWVTGLSGRVLPDPEASRALERRVEALEEENRRQSREIQRLSGLLDQALGLRTPVREQNYRMQVADVVFPTDSSPWRKSLTLARGTRDGIDRGMLVVYQAQVVGRISEAGARTSRVQVVTDPGFRAGAVVVPRTFVPGSPLGDRRVGVYEGTAGPQGQLKWLTEDAVAGPGAWVLTTEDPSNGVPRGLSLGSVASVSHGRGAFPKVDVEPALNLRALEHVMVLIPPPEARAAAGPGGRP